MRSSGSCPNREQAVAHTRVGAVAAGVSHGFRHLARVAGSPPAAVRWYSNRQGNILIAIRYID